MSESIKNEILENLYQYQSVKIYDPDNDHFIALCRQLTYTFFSEFNKFLYVGSIEEYRKIIKEDNTHKQLLFIDFDLDVTDGLSHIYFVQRTKLMKEGCINLTSLQNCCIDLEHNINLLKKKKGRNFDKIDILLMKTGYLLEDVWQNSLLNLSRNKAKDQNLNLFSLTPRTGVSKSLATLLLGINFDKYLEKQNIYEYNHKICARYFYIDDSPENIDQYLKIVLSNDDITIDEIIQIFLFLIHYIGLSNCTSQIDDYFNRLVDLMMEKRNDKNRKTIEMIIKALIERNSAYNAYYSLDLAILHIDEENYELAITKLNTLKDSDDSMIRNEAKMNLAICYIHARIHLDIAKKYLKELLRLKYPRQDQINNLLGLANYYQGKLKEAKKYFDRLMKKYYGLLQKNNITSCEVINNYGLVCIELGKLKEAQECFHNLIEYYVKINGNRPGQYLSDEFDNLGIIYLYENKYKYAADAFLNAIVYNGTDPSKQLSYENYLYACAKNNPLSCQELNELLHIYSDHNIDNAQSLYMIGELFYDRQKYDQALQYLTHAYQLQCQNKQKLDALITDVLIQKIRFQHKNFLYKFLIHLVYRYKYIYYLLKYGRQSIYALKCREIENGLLN